MSFEFKNKVSNPFFPDVCDVTPKEVFENTTQLHLIDVREVDEYTGELGHAPQTRLIVLSTLPDHIKSLPQDKPVVFICRSGGRSAQAAAYAQQEGLKEVYNMQGGMILWNQYNLPTEK